VKLWVVIADFDYSAGYVLLGAFDSEEEAQAVSDAHNAAHPRINTSGRDNHTAYPHPVTLNERQVSA
jgi:hypothetical protein